MEDGAHGSARIDSAQRKAAGHTLLATRVDELQECVHHLRVENNRLKRDSEGALHGESAAERPGKLREG